MGHRISLLIALICGLLASAAPADDLGLVPNSLNIVLKTDPDLDLLMAKAKQLTESAQYTDAVEVYQGVIEKADDRVVAAVDLTKKGGNTGRLFWPAAAAARQALLSAPAALRTEYTSRFESLAQHAFAEGLAHRDVAVLRSLASRYPVTVAAQNARWWSGLLLSDAGDFASAAEVWTEFFSLEPVLGVGEADLPLALLQHTIALARCGQSQRAGELVGRLEREFGGTRRKIGGEDQSVLEYARRTLGQPGVGSNEKHLPETFAAMPSWKFQSEIGVSGWVAFAGNRLMVRTPVNLVCLEQNTGKRIWSESSLMEAAAGENNLRASSVAAGSDRDFAEIQRFAPEATDRLVCCVENSPGAAAFAEMGGMPAGPRAVVGTVSKKFATSSQLVVRDLQSGNLVWRVGRGEGREDFTRTARWISAPTIADGRVYVIALHIQSYHLVCLDLADGRLLWHSLICQRPEMGMGWSAGVDMDRPAPPCVTAGRVLCLSNVGVVACFGRLTGEAFWFYQYAERTADRGAAGWAGNGRNGGRLNKLLVSGPSVLATPADLEEVMAFDVVSGDLLWHRNRENRRFVAGLVNSSSNNCLVVLTGASAAGLSFADGKTVWSTPLQEGTGQPVMNNSVLYVFVRGRGIVQIDACTGRELRCSLANLEGGQHLSVAGGSVVAISSRAVAALRSFQDAVGEMTRCLESAPNEARWWMRRGELQLEAGHPREALSDLLQARARSHPDEAGLPAVDALLFQSCMNLAAADSGESMGWLEKAGIYASTAAMRSERWLRLADLREKQKNWAAAAEALQMILDLEAEAWITLPESFDAAGGRLVGGQISNRALAVLRLESLVDLHGRELVHSAEVHARQYWLAATKAHDVTGLKSVIQRYPVGETQERAWLTLAEWQGVAGRWNAAAEMLLQFLRTQPKAVHKGDAALGLMICGIRSGRGGLARQGLSLLLQAGSEKGRFSFAEVSGTSKELERLMTRELESSPPASAETTAGAVRGDSVPILLANGETVSGQLFFEGNRIVRAEQSNGKPLWKSTTVLDARNNGSGGQSSASLLLDTLVVSYGMVVLALDAESGKLLWRQEGAGLGMRSKSSPQAAVGRGAVRVMRAGGMVWMPRPNRSPELRTPVVLVGDDQLLSLSPQGAVSSLSLRGGEPVWTAELPGPFSGWSNAQPRCQSRFLAVAANAPEGDTNQPGRIAIVDLHRGRLLAVWNPPENSAQFEIQADGRIVIRPSQ